MTPMVHLLLLPFLLSIAAGMDLEELKGPFVDVTLDVKEATPVPYPVHQFEVPEGVTSFSVNGDGTDIFKMSKDGWLYLDKPLDWSQTTRHEFTVEGMGDEDVVAGPITVKINVLDVNNNPPRFNSESYTAMIRERRKPDDPFVRVSATDQDDPTTANARLRYSLDSQVPNNNDIFLFQIDPETGEISTTEEGEEMLKAKPGVQFSRGEERSIDSLKTKFDDYCPGEKIPYEQNPFFSCVATQEMKRRNLDPLEDPDYILLVRVQDLEGAKETALSAYARVHIIVQPNLWVNPGPLTIEENLKGDYPRVIAKVQSNVPDAGYSLVQKERELRFPFQIKENGEILLTEELDREEKDMYILVVFAKDANDNDVDPPMEIQVLVADVNDNEPVCEKEETEMEIQENEPMGSEVGQIKAHDDDQPGTIRSLLTYTISSQDPPSSPESFSIDQTNGRIQAVRSLQRKEQNIYNLDVKVSDSDFSTICKVIIKVIGVNKEEPVFEESYYGNHSLPEDTEVGVTVLTITATDTDEPDTGSSYIRFEISSGNEGDVFTVESDGKGVGYVVIAKPLDFESHSTFDLQIDARNTEPLKRGVEYTSKSTTTLTVTVNNVDEAPEITMDSVDVAVPENFTKGSVLLKVNAQDPEGEEIGFKLDGDDKGWLEINPATGEIRTKTKMDRETLETFDVTVTAFEKKNPDKSSERVVHVRLLDVNDNVPKLTKSNDFICMQNIKPLIIEANDADDDPFSGPFDFAFSRKSSNWKLTKLDDSSAQLQLIKKPLKEGTYTLQITVTDRAGMGIPNPFEVKICNCTTFGYCYLPPHGKSFKPPMGLTIGILVGVLGFCVLIFIIAVKRSSRKNNNNQREDGEQKPMM
ncbi:PREDICTED: cadherin-17 [Poecilia mexicana]|uniref:Cadherin domain-containing protein n=1 Tax=Poecilia mexicana TaxID=48701 RepID=A0A3B3XHF4_9TELE|nr:PREDICTED: cadherin-17 [Poecilia mexicana]